MFSLGLTYMSYLYVAIIEKSKIRVCERMTRSEYTTQSQPLNQSNHFSHTIPITNHYLNYYDYYIVDYTYCISLVLRFQSDKDYKYIQ